MYSSTAQLLLICGRCRTVGKANELGMCVFCDHKWKRQFLTDCVIDFCVLLTSFELLFNRPLLPIVVSFFLFSTTSPELCELLVAPHTGVTLLCIMIITLAGTYLHTVTSDLSRAAVLEV